MIKNIRDRFQNGDPFLKKEFENYLREELLNNTFSLINTVLACKFFELRTIMIPLESTYEFMLGENYTEEDLDNFLWTTGRISSSPGLRASSLASTTSWSRRTKTG